VPAYRAPAGVATATARSAGAPWLLRALATLLLLGGLMLGLMLSAILGALEQSGSSGHRPSQYAIADIPAAYLRLYLAAGRRYGVDWAVLAGIGSIETNHGRLRAVGVRSGANFAGAMGPMQFLGPTFRAYGVDGNGDGRIDVYDPADAIPAAARLLRASGAPQDYHRAIYAYNHAEWYVQDVLARAGRYRGELTDAPPDDGARAGANRESAQALLRNRRVTLTPVQRADLRSGAIDARLTTVLLAIAREHTFVVTALKSDHAPGTNHEAGRASDVGAVDGVLCDGSRHGPCARVARWLARISGELRPTELIYAWDPDPDDPRDFADPVDHSDHLHIGWDG
jgi:Transglycosylase SLT domain